MMHLNFLNTDNTSEEVLTKSYLENVIQEFETSIAYAENFENKTERILIQITSAYPNMP